MSGRDDSGVTAIATELHRYAAMARQRRCLVLAGSAVWGRVLAGGLEQGGASRAWLWVGSPDTAPTGVAWEVVTRDAATRVLGREFAGVVIDGHAGLDPDALGAVAGTVLAGGLLVLLMPPLDHDWRDAPDPIAATITVHPFPPEAVARRFLTRAAILVRGDPQAVVVTEGAPAPELPAAPSPAMPERVPDEVCRTADQAEAVAALQHVVTGQRRRPVVLVADRGRGKSAALGIAAGRLLAEGSRRIVITAPGREAVAPAFEHARAVHPEIARAHDGALFWPDGGALVFRAPEDLVKDNGEDAALVLVDEAAAIPAPWLEELLRRHSRIAFATTVHGYEGTGRGFEVRFRHALDENTRGWRRLALATPVRWADGDPVERLVSRVLLLDAEPAEPGSEGPLDVASLDRDALVADEPTLAAVFGLLVQAHYRTRPRDLRHLLDGPSVRVVVARRGGAVVGVALWALEGDFPEADSTAILRGERRPHGHLLPETLAAHLGLSAAPRLRAARVLRLAVHPEARRAGIGRALLGAVEAAARAHECDYLGASFALDAPLLAFWQRCGYRVVRLSQRRGAVSGSHSAVLLRPLSPDGTVLVDAARACCADDLPLELGDRFRDLPPGLVIALLRDLPVPEPDASDWGVAADVAAGYRLPEAR
ncbi:MAG: GNAT family N-acetyltransferase, partial [Thiohalospira sp.]